VAVKSKPDDTAFRALKRALKAGAPQNLYVFHGEEAYLREYYLGELKKLLLPPGLEQFNLHTARGKECSPEWLEQAADCLPMMSGRTLVVVTDYDLFGGGEGQRKKLLGLFQSLPDYCCMVFVYDLLPYKADGRSKLAGLLKERGAVVEFRRQEQGDLAGWIIRRFKAEGLSADAQDARYLMFLAGDLMTNLVCEIGKIAAYAKGPRVTREDIDAVAVPQVDAVVFQMTDAIARKDFDRAASVLADLFHQQQPAQAVLSAMGKYFRQLYTARLCLENGEGRERLAGLWKMRSAYPAEKLLDAARRFSLPWCRYAVRRCAEVEMSMRGGGDEQALLTSLLMELSAGRRVMG